MSLKNKVLGNRKGVAMIEYALLAALIALFLVTSVTALRDQVATVFDNIRTKLGGVAGG